jgi:hypothetical protein
MAIENGDPRNRDALMATLGRAGSVLATAGAELLSRGLEIGGRRGAAAMAQASDPEQDRASSSSWIDRLLENYRQYLGEMATTLPMIAQRIGKDLENAKGERLLLRIDIGKALYLHKFADPVQAKSLDSMTAGAAKRIEEALGSSSLPDLSDLTARYERLRTLPKLLDRLKYDFRRRGVSALGAIGEEFEDLRNLLASHSNSLEALPAALGEDVFRRIVDDRMHDRLEDVYRVVRRRLEAADRAGHPEPQDSDEIRGLRTQLETAGIVLSESMSLLARARDWILFDHGKNSTFELRLAKPWLEVYGAREGRRYTVQFDATSREILLPVRVHDASQGLAVWTVDKRIVQDHLDNFQPPLKAWDIGTSRTPIALCMVDYREGDLDDYLELGLGCFATPARDPLAVGMFIVGKLPVSTQLACNAGCQIWGYNKVVENLQIQYRDRQVTCTQGSAVSFTLPRRGDGESASIPLFSYTQKAGSWHRTVITRSGSGETVRGGGRGVELTVDPTAHTNLGDHLQYFGLVDEQGRLARAPLFTAWTEHMSAQLGAPSVMVPREPDS